VIPIRDVLGGLVVGVVGALKREILRQAAVITTTYLAQDTGTWAAIVTCHGIFPGY
jgi:hypothetical protein